MSSTTGIIQVVTSTPNTDGSNQVSTFVPSAASQTALLSAEPTPASAVSNDMDMLNMSPTTMGIRSGNRAAVQSDITSTSEADNLFVPGNRLFPLGLTIIVLGGA
jgi:hypothetical protein